ncbi:hypothetical protein RF11_04038 [Thelohanellus kitauei]|uniref:Uncharacterized protein n=1 Tax=Thelohanellus kitauei TaxID=669202 RepID=A0A0C2JQ39_THEKT|nr:hypothetical protein RF11_04038 [Thelohanellus kitauei]
MTTIMHGFGDIIPSHWVQLKRSDPWIDTMLQKLECEYTDFKSLLEKFVSNRGMLPAKKKKMINYFTYSAFDDETCNFNPDRFMEILTTPLSEISKMFVRPERVYEEIVEAFCETIYIKTDMYRIAHFMRSRKKSKELKSMIAGVYVDEKNPKALKEKIKDVFL